MEAGRRADCARGQSARERRRSNPGRCGGTDAGGAQLTAAIPRALRTAAAAALLFLAACSVHKPDFRELQFHATADPQIYQAVALGRTVQLMEPDDVFHPKAWQGPLRIVGACTASVSRVTAVYASRDVGYLLVIDHSGATRFARFIDLHSCREVWPALTAQIPIQVTGDAVSIEPGQWLRLFAEHAPLQ